MTRGAIALLAVFYCTLCTSFATVGRGPGIYLQSHPENPPWCPAAYDAESSAGKGCLSPENQQCRYGIGECCESCEKDLVLGDQGKFCRWPYYLVCDATKNLFDYRAEQAGNLPCDECEIKGIPVMDGTTGEQLACITDPLVTTLATAEGEKVIATQCCSLTPNGKEKCHRWTTCTDGGTVRDSQECCVSGHSKFESVVERTAAAAEAKCSELGLAFCQDSCKDTGCYYNFHPVWAAGTCKP
mmetsp:Transcript_24182/g.47169  ORF Transcript_24182/g.47169 Transcript_24182/m.47169 type:complete len:242 (-) Transcript_24182:401-1126(-)